MATKQLYKTDVIAQLFGVSVRRIQQLTQEGILTTVDDPSGGHKKYDLVPTIQKYIAYLSEKAYNKTHGERENELKEKKLEAEVALKESQGELHKLKTAIASGKYVTVEEVRAEYERFFVAFKKFAQAVPPRVIGYVSNEINPVTARRLEKDMNNEVNTMLRTFVMAAQKDE